MYSFDSKIFVFSKQEDAAAYLTELQEREGIFTIIPLLDSGNIPLIVLLEGDVSARFSALLDELSEPIGGGDASDDSTTDLSCGGP